MGKSLLLAPPSVQLYVTSPLVYGSLAVEWLLNSFASVVSAEDTATHSANAAVDSTQHNRLGLIVVPPASNVAACAKIITPLLLDISARQHSFRESAHMSIAEKGICCTTRMATT